MYWRARERDDRLEPPQDLQHGRPSPPWCRRATRPMSSSDTIGSLLAQDYPGRLRVILVDDESTRRHRRCRAPARRRQQTDRDHRRQARPQGWTGKLWARQPGRRAGRERDAPDYLWLTDADIAHTPDNLRHLVARAEDGRAGADLADGQAALQAAGPSVSSFRPSSISSPCSTRFAWVNDPKRKMAAAAGGCMLIRRDALEAAGGIAAIKSAIIDDCAMGRADESPGPDLARADQPRPLASGPMMA